VKLFSDINPIVYIVKSILININERDSLENIYLNMYIYTLIYDFNEFDILNNSHRAPYRMGGYSFQFE